MVSVAKKEEISEKMLGCLIGGTLGDSDSSGAVCVDLMGNQACEDLNEKTESEN